jgi:hypothetical protein
MKNEFSQIRISRSEQFCRDESIRKIGFCADTGEVGITGIKD